MKQSVIRGWIALVVFIAAILVVGRTLMLNRYLNRGLLILAVASIIVVFLLSWKSNPNEDTGLGVGQLEDE